MKRYIFAVMMLAACGGDDGPERPNGEEVFRQWQAAHREWERRGNVQRHCETNCRPGCLIASDPPDSLDTANCGSPSNVTLDHGCEDCEPQCDGQPLLMCITDESTFGGSMHRARCGNDYWNGAAPVCTYVGEDPGDEPVIEDFQ